VDRRAFRGAPGSGSRKPARGRDASRAVSVVKIKEKEVQYGVDHPEEDARQEEQDPEPGSRSRKERAWFKV